MKKAKEGATRRLRIASCLCLFFMIFEFVGKKFNLFFISLANSQGRTSRNSTIFLNGWSRSGSTDLTEFLAEQTSKVKYFI